MGFIPSFRRRTAARELTTILLLLALTFGGWVITSTPVWSQPAEGYQVHPAFERGFSSETAYEVQVDFSVNLFNGNLSFSLPIGPRLVAEGELTYGFTLAFNSSLWRYDTIVQICDASDDGTPTNEALPASAFNAGLGWTLTGGELYAPGDFPYVDSTQWQLLSGDGALRAFHNKLHENESPSSLEEGVFYTRDSSYLRLRTRTLASRNGARGPSDIVQVVDRDSATGRITKEKTYGGDGAGLGTGALSTLDLSNLTPSYQVEYEYTDGIRTATHWVDPEDAGGLRVTLEDVDLDPATGLVSASRVAEDSVGALIATYGYDNLGRMTSIQPNDDSAFAYLYTPASGSTGARLTTRRTDGGSVLTESEARYDGMGRVIEAFNTLPHGAGRQRVATTYDELGRVETVTVPHLEGSSNPAASLTQYDLMGRACRQTAADGSVTTTRTERTTMRYSRTVPTPAGPSTSNRLETYDDHERLRVVNELSAANGSGVNTKYTYDVAGKLVEVRMNDGVTEAVVQRRTFEYDGRGFLKKECVPEKVGSGGNPGCTTYQGYDALGKASVSRDEDSAYDLEYRYDAVGRLIQVRKADCTSGADCRLQDFAYARGNVANASTDWRIDRLIRARQHNEIPDPRDPSKTLRVTVAETFAYEGPEGRPSKRTMLVTGLRDDGTGTLASSEGTYRFDLEMTYDRLGMVGDLDYPQCDERWCANFFPRTEIEHIYDRGVLSSVGPRGSPSTPYATLTYHPNGMLEKVQHDNGVEDVYSTDPTGMRRISRIRFGTAFDRSLSYQQGYLTAFGPDSFAYDPVDRLASATVSSQSQSSAVLYSYDVAGNLTNRKRDGVDFPHSVDLGSNRITDSSFVYDDSGYLNAFDGVTLTRDSLGRVIRSQGAGADRVFVYNTGGERVATYTVGTIQQPPEASFTLRGLDNKVLRRFSLAENSDGSEDWDLHEDLVYRGNALLVRLRPTSSIALERKVHYHLDHLGTARLLTDPAGAILFRRDFFPFGEQLNPSASDDGVFRFTGHERDFDGAVVGNFDLDYMHARYYSSRLGRFLSLDPAAADAKFPQSWNRYTYVLNSPLIYYDPDGLRWKTGNQYYEDIAPHVEGYKSRSMNEFSDGSTWGIIKATFAGAAADFALGSLDVLRLGDSSGRAFADPSVGTGEAALLVLQDGGRFLALSGAGGVAGRAVTRGARAADKVGTATRSASNDAQLLLPEVSRSGELTQKGLDHIVYRHFASSDAPRAGKFSPGTTARQPRSMIYETIERGQIRPNTNNRPGHIFEYDFKDQLGVDRNGNSASRLRVVRRPDGTIVTSFPY
ncbi:MAG: RHS repeat-associated core domain-containing protein [Acidobacteriota bacterium]